MMNQANKNLTSHDLTFLRQIAVAAGNTTLVEITNLALSTGDEAEAESLLRLYHQEFPDDALVSGIWCNTRVRRWLSGAAEGSNRQ
jgi:hypothetical protein